MMYATARCLVVTFVLAMLIGCSTTVPSGKVYGTYVASYPFGTATLTLNRDGSFTQRATIKGQPPATVQGSWSFDPIHSKITMHGAMNVIDGYGHLNNDWRTTDDLPEVPVERLWFKINIESSTEYPYVKQ
jgi:hypothetical protein